LLRAPFAPPLAALKRISPARCSLRRTQAAGEGGRGERSSRQAGRHDSSKAAGQDDKWLTTQHSHTQGSTPHHTTHTPPPQIPPDHTAPKPSQPQLTR
jgi:hypothetical protein